MLARPAMAGNRKDQRDVKGIDLLMLGYADRPDETPSAQTLAECSRQAIPGIGQHDTEAQARRYQAVNLFQGDLRFGAWLPHRLGNAGL